MHLRFQNQQISSFLLLITVPCICFKVIFFYLFKRLVFVITKWIQSDYLTNNIHYLEMYRFFFEIFC